MHGQNHFKFSNYIFPKIRNLVNIYEKNASKFYAIRDVGHKFKIPLAFNSVKPHTLTLQSTLFLLHCFISQSLPTQRQYIFVCTTIPTSQRNVYALHSRWQSGIRQQNLHLRVLGACASVVSYRELSNPSKKSPLNTKLHWKAAVFYYNTHNFHAYFLGAFAKLWQATMSSSCLSARIELVIFSEYSVLEHFFENG